MNGLEWLQLLLLLIVLTLLTKPLGLYLFSVLTPDAKTPLDFLLKPLERATYRLCGIDTKSEQTWVQYLVAILLFSFVSLLFTFLLLTLQPHLPLNPERMGAMSADLNFNTAISYVTNTDWQNYSGESALSYFSQMVTLTLQNFISPAVALAVVAALARGIARTSSKTLGNFWVDLIRVIYYLLVPLAFIVGLFFISQGTPQNFDAYTRVTTVETGQTQVIVQGPIAAQEAIKLLGSNGGGYTNAGSAHPYENPSPLTNFLQILFILLIPAAQTYYFGKEVKSQKHGWCLYAAMALVLVVATFFTHFFERQGNPHFSTFGIEQSGGNMEGKEERFGLFGSSLFASATTCTSNGSINSEHGSYTPLSSLVLLMNMQLGEVIFGGVGCGLYSILIFVILTVFTAGLIIGRTPEYLGKRIEAFDVKAAILTLIPFVVTILGFTALACSSKVGLLGRGAPFAHGFTEMFYAYTSTAANNGSAFSSLVTNIPWWNVTLGFAMLFGRFCTIVPILALAGSLASKKRRPFGLGSFPVTGVSFTLLLVCTIILIGVLCFLPGLIIGPCIEQFSINPPQAL